MRLKHINSGQWNIYAAQTDRGDCPLLAFLAGLDKSYSANVASMLSLLEAVTERTESPNQWIPQKKCHSITSDNKIWQFTVGRLRVAWFYDHENVIICTHGFFKDSQETKTKDKKIAQKTRDNYFLAQQQNRLIIEKEDM